LFFNLFFCENPIVIDIVSGSSENFDFWGFYIPSSQEFLSLELWQNWRLLVLFIAIFFLLFLSVVITSTFLGFLPIVVSLYVVFVFLFEFNFSVG